MDNNAGLAAEDQDCMIAVMPIQWLKTVILRPPGGRKPGEERPENDPLFQCAGEGP